MTANLIIFIWKLLDQTIKFGGHDGVSQRVRQYRRWKEIAVNMYRAGLLVFYVIIFWSGTGALAAEEADAYSPFRGVRCYGQTQYSCRDLQRGFRRAPGQTLTEADLELLRLQLDRRLGIERFQVAVEDNGQGSVLQIQVEDRSSLAIGADVGVLWINEQTGLYFGTGAVDDNWLGGGGEFSIDMRTFSLTPRDERRTQGFHTMLAYKSPTWGENDWFYEIGTRAFDQSKRQGRVVNSPGEFSKERIETSVSAGLGMRFWPDVGAAATRDLSLGVRAFLNGETLEKSVGDDLAVREESDKLRAGVYVRYAGDSRDDRFLPSRGQLWDASIEVLSTDDGGTLVPWNLRWQGEWARPGGIWVYRLGPDRSDPFQPFSALPLSAGYGWQTFREKDTRERWLVEAGANPLSISDREDDKVRAGLRLSYRVLGALGPLEVFLFGIF
jgi:hypothetical protein